MRLSSVFDKYKLEATIKGKFNIMSDKNPSLARKAVNAGGWSLARRLAKSVPYAGTADRHRNGRFRHQTQGNGLRSF